MGRGVHVASARHIRTAPAELNKTYTRGKSPPLPARGAYLDDVAVVFAQASVDGLVPGKVVVVESRRYVLA